MNYHSVSRQLWLFVPWENWSRASVGLKKPRRSYFHSVVWYPNHGWLFFIYSRGTILPSYLSILDGGSNVMFVCSRRKLGKIPILTSIFFKWLKAPTSIVLSHEMRIPISTSQPTNGMSLECFAASFSENSVTSGDDRIPFFFPGYFQVCEMKISISHLYKLNHVESILWFILLVLSFPFW